MPTSMEKRARVPKLRFPEFRDAEGWEEKKLIDTADKKVRWSFIGGPFGSNLKSSDYVDDGIRIIQLQNIGDTEFIDDYRIFTSKEKADELLSNNIYPGEIILSKMGDPVGRACLVPSAQNRYVMCSDGIRLVVNENLNNKYFIYLLINSMQFRSLVERTATGSTRKRIGLDELKNLPMLLPKKCEQQKIADCLASLDERITLETQKLDTLKIHKKGLMQQLFPKVAGASSSRGFETREQDAPATLVPKLRFPEFRDAGEWEEKSLGDVAKITSGGTPNRVEVDYWGGSIPWITTSLIDFNTIDDAEEFITTEGLKNSSAKLFPAQTLLMAMYGQGKTRGKVALLGIEATTNQACAAILLNKEVNTNFVFQNLGSRYGEIRKLSNEGGQENLSTGLIKEIPLTHPGFKEQQKIANCLTSLDDLIAAQTQKLAVLKTHKKGLMQQLFPVLDEAQA